MKGFRTIIANGGIIVFALLKALGVDIPVDDQTAITAGLIALSNIGLRLITTTKAGEAK